MKKNHLLQKEAQAALQKYDIANWETSKKAAAVIVPWCRSIEEAINYHQMGIIGLLCSSGSLFNHSALEAKKVLQEIQSRTDNNKLFFCDMEMGAGQPFPHSDPVLFPWLMAFGAVGSAESCYLAGYSCGIDARWIGIHITLSPVFDVNTEPSNPICNIRSIGDDSQLVSLLANSWAKGQQNAGVGACAKHFPGEGMQKKDPHLGLELIEASEKELRETHIAAFFETISDGVSAIMTNHAIYGNLDPIYPVTMSKKIVSRILRDQMLYNGLIMTDALEMKALEGNFEHRDIVIKAINAGHDILLGPTDPTASVYYITEAIKSGEIDIQQLNLSIARILAARDRYVNQEKITEEAWKKTNKTGWEIADSVASKSICMPRNVNNLLPLKENYTNGKHKVLCLEMAHPTSALSFGLDLPKQSLLAPVRKIIPNAKCLSIPLNPSSEEMELCVKMASEYDLVLIATSFRSESGQGGLLAPIHIDLFEKITNTQPNVVFIAGNPYSLQQLPFAHTALTTYSHSPISIKYTIEYIFERRCLNTNPHINLKCIADSINISYISHDA